MFHSRTCRTIHRFILRYSHAQQNVFSIECVPFSGTHTLNTKIPSLTKQNTHIEGGYMHVIWGGGCMPLQPLSHETKHTHRRCLYLYTRTCMHTSLVCVCACMHTRLGYMYVYICACMRVCACIPVHVCTHRAHICSREGKRLMMQTFWAWGLASRMD